MPVSDPELQTTLEHFQQTAVLAFWDQLSAEQRVHLEQQLQDVDFQTIHNVLRKHRDSSRQSSESGPDKVEIAEAPASVVWQPTTDADYEQRKTASRIGEKLLSENRVAVITVAGGQGSRLGFEHPKGMFPIGPVSDRTLFQIFAEQIQARQKKHGCRIPWLLMTSAATHQETIEFFESKDYFGLDRDTVHFFQQGSMPAVDCNTGKLLLDAPDRLCLSPDGHGGLITALRKSGLLDQMKDAGVEHFFYHQVDNPTIILCDPVLMGLHVQHQSELTTNVIRKVSPTERMGVLAEVDGRLQIIEYSELTEEQASREDSSGQWIFWAGNTAIHVVQLSFFDRLTQKGAGLELHLAHKKVPHIDEAGNRVEPDSPNAYKFERFIFDALPLAGNALVVEGDRALEFNPVKNASGSDSPDTARAALDAIGRAWLADCGHDVPEDQTVEISPLVALNCSDLQAAFDRGQVTVQDLISRGT